MSFLFGLEAARLCMFMAHPPYGGCSNIGGQLRLLLWGVYQTEDDHGTKSISRAAALIPASTVSLAQGHAAGGAVRWPAETFEEVTSGKERFSSGKIMQSCR
jgi:hypothetical protein